MPTDRVRIVPRYEKRWDVALGLFIGLVLGAIAGAIGEPLLDALGIWFTPAFVTAVLFVCLVPVIVLALIPYFTHAERPIKSVFISFTIVWPGAFVAAWNITSPFAVGTNVTFAPAMGAAASLAGALGALIFLLPGLLWRKLVHRCVVLPMPQDGDRCWRCAYQLGSERIERCPECGRPRDVSRYKWGWLYRAVARAQSRAWSLLIGAAILLSAIAAFIIWDRGLPMMRLDSAIQRQHMLMRLGSRIEGDFGFSARGPTVALRNAQVRNWAHDVVIRYSPHRLDEGPILQLRAARMAFPRVLGITVPTNPLVCCDLNREQAEFVLNQTIPAELLEEMWRHARMQRRPVIGPVPTPPQPPIIIDPQPFIDALRRTSQ